MMNYISILFLCLCFSWTAIVPDRVERKANKEIKKHYNIKEFEKESFSVSEEINLITASEFGDENLFRILSGGELLGFGYIGSAEAKVSVFDYLVIFDTDMIIVKTKVLVYREEYGGEISSKRWLKQFIGVSSASSELIYKKDILPISGATISVRSMTNAINDLLKSIKLLQEKELL